MVKGSTRVQILTLSEKRKALGNEAYVYIHYPQIGLGNAFVKYVKGRQRLLYVYIQD